MLQKMTSESARIADQLRRAFAGDPWHGSPLRDLLSGVTPEMASSRLLPATHTIWELVSHIEIYVQAAGEAVRGVPMPHLFGTEKDWPRVASTSPAAWTAATTSLFDSAERLAGTIDRFSDTRLRDTVPGRDYDFYYLFHGIVQHSLYHAGQIAMLKKAISG